MQTLGKYFFWDLYPYKQFESSKISYSSPFWWPKLTWSHTRNTASSSRSNLLARLTFWSHYLALGPQENPIVWVLGHLLNPPKWSRRLRATRRRDTESLCRSQSGLWYCHTQLVQNTREGLGNFWKRPSKAQALESWVQIGLRVIGIGVGVLKELPMSKCGTS